MPLSLKRVWVWMINYVKGLRIVDQIFHYILNVLIHPQKRRPQICTKC